MSMFSQSLVLGENTLLELDKKNIASPLPQNTNKIEQHYNDDIIDESPNNKTNANSTCKSRLRMRTQKKLKKDKTKTKSASKIATSSGSKIINGSNGNCSEFFKSDMVYNSKENAVDIAVPNIKQDIVKLHQNANVPTVNECVSNYFKESFFDVESELNKNFFSNKTDVNQKDNNLQSMFDDSDFFQVENDQSNHKSLDNSVEDCMNMPISSEDIADIICTQNSVTVPSISNQYVNKSSPKLSSQNIVWDDSESFNNISYNLQNMQPNLNKKDVGTKFPVNMESTQNISPPKQHNSKLISKLDSESIIWNDSIDFDNISKNKVSNTQTHLNVDDVVALGIDNVTFTQDFLKLQSFENDFNSDNGSNKLVKVFIDNEMEVCRNDVEIALSETKADKSRENINASVRQSRDKHNLTAQSNILLNLSESLIENSPAVNSIVIKQSALSNKNKDVNNIENWGLPSTIVKAYIRKGIQRMFDWQAECLSNTKVLGEGANLVYSAPTSAGKTLDLLIPAGVCVEGFFGGYTPPGGFDNTHIAICTIEKANSIVNKLLEQNKIENIGCIVVDEIHLISDPGRGYILELLLAKILYVCKKFDHRIQIITMSATLPNLELLTKWLNAEYYFSDFRPVELKEMIKIGNDIYDNKMKLIRKLDMKNNDLYAKDQDNVGQLCIETIMEGCSVIIFCPSKDWCESLCHHIAGLIYLIGKGQSEFGEKLRAQINFENIEEIKSQLRNCPSGLDGVLEQKLSYGCAFHHAGLTSDERDIIESGFKSSVLRVIVATSTLSSGVNLPARRVIIRTPLFGGKTMNSLTYKQMIGRAGRTGKDTLGESILICTDTNKKSGTDLVCAKLKPLSSCLDADNNINLKRAILEIIASGIATTKIDLENFTNCTLLSSEKNKKFEYNPSSEIKSNPARKKKNIEINSFIEDDNDETNPIASCMKFLISYEFIRLQMNEDKNEMNYVPTKLGQACLASSMPPGDGFLLFSELQKSRQCFVLESELHAIYLVTPFSVCYQMQDIDWLGFLDLWEKLPSSMRRVGELVGVKESFLVKAMRNHKLDYKILQIHKRFYTALALQELVNEEHVTRVALKYKCSRGLLQSLQQMASTFAGIVTSFCNALSWGMLALIISQFKDRLFFGVHRDLIELMKLTNLNSQRARALFNAGFETLIDLANADTFTVEKTLYNCICFDTKKRDGENDFDAIQRNNIRCLYVTGKTSLTVREAAKLIIEDARRYIEQEMGIQNVNWATKKSIEIKEILPAQAETLPNTKHKISKLESEDIFQSISPVKDSSKRKSNEMNSTLSSPEKQIKLDNVTKMPPSSKENLNPVSIRRSPRIQKKKEMENSIKPILYEKQNISVSTANKNISVPTNRSTVQPTVIKECSMAVSNQNSSTKPINNSLFDINSQIRTLMDEKSTVCTVSKTSKPKKSPSTKAVNISNSDCEIQQSQTPVIKTQRGRKIKNSIMVNQLIDIEQFDSIDFSHTMAEKSTINDISHILSVNKHEESSVILSRLNIVNVFGNKTFFMKFEEEINVIREIGLSIGVNRFFKSKPAIGSNLLINQLENAKEQCEEHNCIYDDSCYIAGISICIDDNTSYYLNLQNDQTDPNITFDMKIDFLKQLFHRENITIKMFDTKEQCKILANAIPGMNVIKVKLEDPKIANWLLQPAIEMNLFDMVTQYAPECIGITELGGTMSTSKSLGLNYTSSISAKIRASVECCAIVHILKSQIENLNRINNGNIYKSFIEMEMPIQHSLFLMERTGFSIDIDEITKLSEIITELMRKLEIKIYQLHGRRFNIGCSKEVAKVLGLQNKYGGTMKISTTKPVLEKNSNPIANLILQYRKLSATLNKTIQPIIRNTVNNKIYGNSISFTSTGRISMHEPNLQNVAKDFNVEIDSKIHNISCRNVFKTTKGRCLISADFCQLELRILTHLSKDPLLLKIMKSKQDVFAVIAAKWNKVLQSEVTEDQRNKTKTICYGIIYGMGIKSLAEVLKCDESDAITLSESFHMTYPGIRSYTDKIVKYVRQEGFTETIAGRRRYFSHINSADSNIKAHAERQAINTTIQGSAADIAKYAILRMERNIQKYTKTLKINILNNSSSNVDFVLHLHDELIYEVPVDKYKQIAKILKSSMENCAILNVPLMVKLKMGDSWGSLKVIDF